MHQSGCKPLVNLSGWGRKSFELRLHSAIFSFINQFGNHHLKDLEEKSLVAANSRTTRFWTGYY